MLMIMKAITISGQLLLHAWAVPHRVAATAIAISPLSRNFCMQYGADIMFSLWGDISYLMLSRTSTTVAEILYRPMQNFTAFLWRQLFRQARRHRTLLIDAWDYYYIFISRMMMIDTWRVTKIKKTYIYKASPAFHYRESHSRTIPRSRWDICCAQQNFTHSSSYCLSLYRHSMTEQDMI